MTRASYLHLQLTGALGESLKITVNLVLTELRSGYLGFETAKKKKKKKKKDNNNRESEKSRIVYFHIAQFR